MQANNPNDKIPDVPLCLAALWLFAPLGHAGQLSATPYRPTISNPAELSALRHVEVEFGTQLNQPGEQEQRNSLPFLIKYPFHGQWGLLVGGEAWLETSDATGSDNGFGNTAVLLKHYYPFSKTLAVGFEAGAVLPTAHQPLGQERTDYLGNLILSQDIDELRIDVNAGVTRQGYKAANTSRYFCNWALAASHPLTGRWGIAGEFSGIFYPQQQSTSQFLATFTYAPTPQLVLDFGGTIGLTDASDDYSAFAGFTLLLIP
ncbi:MAG: transporter [Methylovulum sp.]|nr:transporter [Methylovulum sp.]